MIIEWTLLCVFVCIVQELANALIPAAVSQYMFQGQEAEAYTTAGYEEQWVSDTTASNDPLRNNQVPYLISALVWNTTSRFHLHLLSFKGGAKWKHCTWIAKKFKI